MKKNYEEIRENIDLEIIVLPASKELNNSFSMSVEEIDTEAYSNEPIGVMNPIIDNMVLNFC